MSSQRSTQVTSDAQRLDAPPSGAAPSPSMPDPMLEKARAKRAEDMHNEEEDDETFAHELEESLAAEEPDQGGREQQQQQQHQGQGNTVYHSVTETYIDKMVGDLHIGPKVFLPPGPPVPAAPSSALATYSDEQKKHIKDCSKSHRVLEMEELDKVAREVKEGSTKWRSLGNALKFNYAELDHIDQQKSASVDNKVELMLGLWVQKNDERATVCRLTKALWKLSAYNAILQLRP